MATTPELTENEIGDKIDQFMQSLDKLAEESASLQEWRMDPFIDKNVEDLHYDFLSDSNLI